MKEMQERGVLHRTSTSHGCNHNNTSLYEGISFSAPHKTNGSRCLVLSIPSSDRAVVLAGFTPDDVEETQEAAVIAREDQGVA